MNEEKIEQNLNDLIETVGYIKDNMATKEDLAKCATKDDLAKCATKDDLAELSRHVDGMETRLVSKSYLDDKLSDLGAEIGERINRR